LPERYQYLICPICFWEDEGQDLDEPDEESGPNHMTLRQARQNFVQFGACERTMVKNVIPITARAAYRRVVRQLPPAKPLVDSRTVGLDLLDPWEPFLNVEQAETFERQCLAEVSRDHELHGRIGRALAHRSDRDDALFELTGGPKSLVVIHLSWSATSNGGDFPSFEAFDDLSDWQIKMREDHDDWSD
jgi:hypothetical protein